MPVLCFQKGGLRSDGQVFPSPLSLLSQTAASSLLPKTVHRVVFLMHLLGQGPGVAVLGDKAAAAFRRLALPWEDGAVPGASRLSPRQVHPTAHPAVLGWS